MANLIETPGWEVGIYQWETTDPVEGGPAGVDNVPTRQLANRTAYLKQLIETLDTGKQPLDGLLTALAALVTSADKTLYFTGADAVALTTLTAYMRTVLAAVDAAAARTVLGAASPADVAAAVAALVDSSPGTLDTLNELAAALGDDANFATTITNALALKAPLASPALSGVPTTPTAAPGTNTTQVASTAFVDAAIAASPVAAVLGACKNLKVVYDAGTIVITADEIALENAAGGYYLAKAVNLTINTATAAGALAIDTGAWATSTWYYPHVLWNGSALTAVASLSPTAPTLPAGYATAHHACVGAARSSAAGATSLLSVIQHDDVAQYKVGGANVAAMPQMASGVSGSIATPTWTAVAVGSYVPPTAQAITVAIFGTGDSANGTAAAPNNSYGAASANLSVAQVNPPPLVASNTESGGGPRDGRTGTFLLESTNIYYAAGRVNGAMHCCGWRFKRGF